MKPAVGLLVHAASALVLALAALGSGPLVSFAGAPVALLLVAQALAGRALTGGANGGALQGNRTREQAAIDRLLAAWKRVVEENLFVR